jgi:hypothetical protein
MNKMPDCWEPPIHLWRAEMHEAIKHSTVDIPGLPGEWRMRESFPEGLDAAGHLNNIAYFSNGEWHRGITTEQVQYWIRVDSNREQKKGGI